MTTTTMTALTVLMKLVCVMLSAARGGSVGGEELVAVLLIRSVLGS
uniref:Uncharacterized protein n=1 Tax=Setaria viridis TaxID=4556 RepID=A0A4U6UNS5_SETVI|nr:hypothetical protein SEVIR_5G252016v2 [Setaria viridis]